MMRSILGSLVAAALLAGTVHAQKIETPANSEYYAGADVQTDGSCPGGDYGPGGLHHGRGGAPLSIMSGYPDGVTNYDDRAYARAWAGPGGCRTCNAGNCQYRFYGQPDLFYNYYAWPSCTGLGAELYISPRPVPPHVGHTYITYQPLYPHEFLYTHHRTYHQYYNGGQGLNRTKVHWYHSPFGQISWPAPGKFVH